MCPDIILTKASAICWAVKRRHSRLTPFVGSIELIRKGVWSATVMGEAVYLSYFSHAGDNGIRGHMFGRASLWEMTDYWRSCNDL